MVNLRTRKYDAKIRIEQREAERHKKADVEHMSRCTFKRACKSLKISDLGDITTGRQVSILEKYIDFLQELQQDIKDRFGVVPKKANNKLSGEINAAINAIVYYQIDQVNPVRQ